MAQYIVVSNVKKLAKQNGRRVGKDFLSSLDRQIEEWVVRAAQAHNGGKKTLDATLAAYSRRAA